MTEKEIEKLRLKVNKITREEQIQGSIEFLRIINPEIKVFSNHPPVDKMSSEDEEHYRQGIIEANNLRKEGKL